MGGDKTIRSDFRLIAATNQNLEELIRRGLFRSDLYYRINVFPIHVVPLRERTRRYSASRNLLYGKICREAGKENTGREQKKTAQAAGLLVARQREGAGAHYRAGSDF